MTGQKIELFDNLKTRMRETTGKEINIETHDSVLNFALKNNPIIIEANSKHRH